MLDISLNLGENETLDIGAMKLAVADFAAQVKADKDYDTVREELKKKSLVEIKK
jgi:hypothetical protein